MKKEYIIYIAIAIIFFAIFPALFALSLIVAAFSMLIYFYFVKPLKNRGGKVRHTRYSFNLYLLAFCILLMLVVIPLTKVFLFLAVVFVVYFGIKYFIDMLISFFVD